VDVLFGVRLHRYGIDAHAGRNTARLALAAELPAAVLADLAGTSVSTAERWSQWASEIGSPMSASATGESRDSGDRKLTNPTN
jgi:hypothetical protein